MRSRFTPDPNGRPASGRGHDRGEFGFSRRGGPPHRGGPHPRRARRGDIRLALLAGLSDGPAHGYELIQRLAARTGGRWKPSPGSVYPTLQMLEDAGFVTCSQLDDKKVYAITEAGTAELAAKTEEAGGAPAWLDAETADGHGDLRKALGQLVMAVKQIGMSDDPQQVERAAVIINDARRSLYQLLAE